MAEWLEYSIVAQRGEGSDSKADLKFPLEKVLPPLLFQLISLRNTAWFTTRR